MSDGIVLIGLPGSGKTTVGRAVAQSLGRPFVDIDAEVQRISGCPPAELIVRDGEQQMRAVERQAVAVAVRSPAAVIATGGGTVIDPLNRWLLMEHGSRFMLDAPPGALAARLRASATRRPLLGDDLEDGLRRTADSRASVYAAVDSVVDAGGDRKNTVAAVLAAREHIGQGWRPLVDVRYERNHPAGPASGRLLMGRGLTNAVIADCTLGRPALVADRRALASVRSLTFDPERTYEVDGGERLKSISELERLLSWLSGIRLERSASLVVIGGGTVGDLGGLAAALHRRGVPLVSVPTTWLAQADSAIGGKVAIDLPDAKNGVGTFWPAVRIVADVAFLDALPTDRRRDGMAECLKAGLIGDPALWQLVEERGAAALNGDDPAAAFAITERAARVKLDIVNRDPYESGERRQLNLGHTIGHALEIESGYTLAHGAAVALGLRAVAHMATQRGAQAEVATGIDAVLATLGFDLTRRFDPASVTAATLSDKKRESGRQRWLLPMAVGEVVEVDDVTPAELDAALKVITA